MDGSLVASHCRHRVSDPIGERERDREQLVDAFCCRCSFVWVSHCVHVPPSFIYVCMCTEIYACNAAPRIPYLVPTASLSM